MRFGLTVLVVGVFLFLAGVRIRSKRSSFLDRMMKQIGFRRLLSLLMGRRSVRRLL